MRSTVSRPNDDGEEIWDFEAWYAQQQGGPNSMPNNIVSALRPVTAAQARPIRAARCHPLLATLIPAPGALLLLAGHPDLTEFETQLTAAYRTNGNTDPLALGALDVLVQETANHYNADFVIVDTSPAKGVLNQHVVCMSDYLIVPTAADYFSFEAFSGLTRMLPDWLGKRDYLLSMRTLPPSHAPEQVRANVALMRVPRHHDRLPKILGALLSRFQIQNGVPIKNTQYWIAKIDQFLTTTFKDALGALPAADGTPRSMFLPEAVYSQVRSIEVDGKDGCVLGASMMLINLKDFGQLNSLSQQYCVPVTGLAMEQMTKFDEDGTVRKMSDIHARQQYRRLLEFQRCLRKLAVNIVQLTLDPPVHGGG